MQTTPQGAPADLEQKPEQYPAPTEKRGHPEVRDDGQHADRGEQRSPPVSRRAEGGGFRGEAVDEVVASQQDSEPGQGHRGLLPVFLVHPEHHQRAAPPHDQIEEDEPRYGVPDEGGGEYLFEILGPLLRPFVARGRLSDAQHEEHRDPAEDRVGHSRCP